MTAWRKAQPPSSAAFNWVPLAEVIQGFTLEGQGMVWEVATGWWASRRGTESYQGPFASCRLAQEWVVDP